MRKVWVIAVRDYNAAVRTKSFVVSIVFMPILMLGSFLVQTLLKDRVDTRPKTFAVIDHTEGEKIFPVLEAAANARREAAELDPKLAANQREYRFERVQPATETELKEQRFDLSERVRKGELAGIVEIGHDVAAGAPPFSDFSTSQVDDRQGVRFQAHSHTIPDFINWLGRTVSVAVQNQRCQTRGLPPDTVRAAMLPVPVLPRELSVRLSSTGEIREGGEASRLASFLLPTALVMMMFMMIFGGATPLMQGVVEEKMNRVAEVLLGSISPFSLMLGKLLGALGVATTLGLIYLGSAYLAANHYGYTEFLTPRVIAWFLVYQTLGIILFGSLFIAVGSACTNAQEVQTMMLPVMLLAMMPLFVMSNVVSEPEGTLATTVSFIPPATPMLMVARVATVPGLPWWQPAVGVVSVLATTLLCVWAAGRIFRVGILLQGKGASFGDLTRWVIRG